MNFIRERLCTFLITQHMFWNSDSQEFASNGRFPYACSSPSEYGLVNCTIEYSSLGAENNETAEEGHGFWTKFAERELEEANSSFTNQREPMLCYNSNQSAKIVFSNLGFSCLFAERRCFAISIWNERGDKTRDLGTSFENGLAEQNVCNATNSDEQVFAFAIDSGNECGSGKARVFDEMPILNSTLQLSIDIGPSNEESAQVGSICFKTLRQIDCEEQ